MIETKLEVIAKFWHRENFTGIAKISLCRSEIHCSPMLDHAASVPWATVPYILQLAIIFTIFFLL